MSDSKRKLDTLLAEWRPKDSQGHDRDVQGTDPKARVRLFVDFPVLNSCET